MKKKILIIVITLAIIGLAVYFYLKSKKKALTAPATATAAPAIVPEVKSTVQTTVAPKTNGASQVTTSPTTVQPTFIAPTTTPASSSTEFKFVNVIKDGSKGKAIIQFQPVTADFKIGESVRILSGPYAGVHKIWYIYKGTQSGAPVHNLYLETDYKTQGQVVPGTFYRA